MRSVTHTISWIISGHRCVYSEHLCNIFQGSSLDTLQLRHRTSEIKTLGSPPMPQNMKQLLLSVISVWITALLFTAPSFGQQQTLSLSLEDAVELALENNREIKISEFDVEAAESGLREATGGFLPEVSASGQYLRNVKRPVFFIGDGFTGMEGGAIEVGYKKSIQDKYTTTQQPIPRHLTHVTAHV